MFQPSLPLVNLAGLVMSTLFYGMYFVIFCTSMYLLFARATAGQAKYLPLLTSAVFLSGIALFICVTSVCT
jgi:hypothetical protein